MKQQLPKVRTIFLWIRAALSMNTARAGSYQFTPIDPAGPIEFSIAFGVNNAGQAVESSLDADFNSTAFLYSSGVSAFLSAPGAASGSDALGINNAGTIVGDYSDADGNVHAFIAASVPEPSTALLAAVAFPLIVAWANGGGPVEILDPRQRVPRTPVPDVPRSHSSGRLMPVRGSVLFRITSSATRNSYSTFSPSRTCRTPSRTILVANTDALLYDIDVIQFVLGDNLAAMHDVIFVDDVNVPLVASSRVSLARG